MPTDFFSPFREGGGAGRKGYCCVNKPPSLHLRPSHAISRNGRRDIEMSKSASMICVLYHYTAREYFNTLLIAAVLVCIKCRTKAQRATVPLHYERSSLT